MRQRWSVTCDIIEELDISTYSIGQNTSSSFDIINEFMSSRYFTPSTEKCDKYGNLNELHFYTSSELKILYI